MLSDFLSDLCGREVPFFGGSVNGLFLSDLCGREETTKSPQISKFFLSDLCGREVPSMLKTR